MDLLTSSFHSNLGSPRNPDNDQPSDTNPENFKFTDKSAFPENLIDFQCTLAGRESFSTEGRDSLGILQSFGNEIITPKVILEPVEEVSFVQMDIDGRESLGLLMNSSFLESGRDSLWKSCFDIVPISVSSNLLNVGFMKLSATSSVSSTGSSFRPSLCSLGSDLELSKIFSVNSRENTNSLNTAFVDSNKIDELGPEVRNSLENNAKDQENSVEDLDIVVENVKEIDDTVFFNSIIVANEIENGSILNDLPDDLYLTQPPELLDTSFDEIVQPLIINNTETILKSVDKFFPVETAVKIDDLNLNKSLEDSAVSNLTKTTDFTVLRTEVPRENNLLAVQSTDKLNTSISPKFSHNRSRNSSGSRSRDAKDLLHNLSTIISTENVENQSEVKKLLQDLANVLLVPNNSKEQNDDSGHSSIEENDVEVALNFHQETLSLHQKSHENNENPSMRRLSQSLCVDNSSKNVTNGASAIASTNKSQKTRQKSLEELDNLKKSNVRKLTIPGVKMIPKKIETVKKGPMKAVVPVANMKRRSITQPKNVDTPGKHTFDTSSYLKRHRTSTPKMWDNAPVAQSTPEEAKLTGSLTNLEKSLHYSGGKIPSPMTPKLATSSLNKSSRKELLGRSSSASAPNISRSDSPRRIPSIATLVSASSRSHLISRRRSVSEIKYTSRHIVATAANVVQATTFSNMTKSPLTRFNNGMKTTAESENIHSFKRAKCSPGSNAAEKDRVKGGNRDSKTDGLIKNYLSERNKNLMQYVTPLNLLDKMKK